ncbi:MAG: TlyA family RNA methyltransferase [Candidatus Delongbacteria bacterium]|nr:TlyA family RNA methyltransferase [Candidatus Delongbacteria bacterium]
MEKKRLDILITLKGLCSSRQQAQRLIGAGGVSVAGRIIKKAAYPVDWEEEIRIIEPERYVGRGGYKLEAAIREFGIPVEGITAMDIGSSTGGFSDCLLGLGARRIIAVDVGHYQMAEKLRRDPRIELHEDTDIRSLGSISDRPDLIVMDLSFISLRLVLPHVVQYSQAGRTRVIALIKPQFECGRPGLVKKGIIRNERLRHRIVQDLLEWIQAQHWKVHGLIPSPIAGGDGNIEYLVDLSLT